MGRELSLFTLPAGERPREGGDVDSPFCSNLARKEATSLGNRPDMTAKTKQSQQEQWNLQCHFLWGERPSSKE